MDGRQTPEGFMESIASTIEVAAAPSKIYEAVTTTAGERAWWTNDCEVGARVGEEAVFRFNPMGGGGGTMEVCFRIDKLERDRSVEWTCVRQVNNPDWQGTTVSFRLAPSGAVTRLDFVHGSWRERTKVYEACVAGWTHFLASLKSYAETGKGTPHQR
jgi:uncharacterized protein YndB with AHSA1/START domain